MNRPDMNDVLKQQQKFFNSLQTLDLSYRKSILKRFLTLIKANRENFVAALFNDLHKCEFEALATEYLSTLESCKYLIRNLRKLSKPRRAGISLFNLPAHGRIIPEPYGTVLIGATWNYPMLLALEPVFGAIAAGNTVVLRLPEQSANVSELLEKIIRENFPPELITTTGQNYDTLMQYKFDYIFFTGSARMGKFIMREAAENLTPLTLELGGKSPCIVDQSCNIKRTAQRIVWGKFLNAGQTCVAPDYLLVHVSVKDALCKAMRECVRKEFGENPFDSPDYCRIINGYHFDRLDGLLSEGRLICGGEKDREHLYIAPTLIDKITPESPIMQEEIFGPILPILSFETIDEVVDFVNKRPKPLALYLFSRSRNNCRQITRRTSSGGMCINETITHLTNASMPFGGVGDSGMGAYHGKYSFKTFSHYKPVMTKSNLPDMPLRYPPFHSWKLKILQLICRW